MNRRLGNLERQKPAYAQLRGPRDLRKGDLTGPRVITGKQEREQISRMKRFGLIGERKKSLGTLGTDHGFVRLNNPVQ